MAQAGRASVGLPGTGLFWTEKVPPGLRRMTGIAWRSSSLSSCGRRLAGLEVDRVLAAMACLTRPRSLEAIAPMDPKPRHISGDAPERLRATQ